MGGLYRGTNCCRGHLGPHLYCQKAFWAGSFSPGTGLVSFLTSAVVIYLTQFIVASVEVSIIGALLASAIIGVIDAIVPTELR